MVVVRIALLAALGLALTIASIGPSTAAPNARPSVITNPDWARKPSGEDFARYYPRLAQILSIDGQAVVACAVDDLGLLEGCTTVSEKPAGLGFGAAALSMSSAFRMRPMTRDGRAVAGGHVRIPISFRFPPPAPPPPSPAFDPAARSYAQFLADQMMPPAAVGDLFANVRKALDLATAADASKPEAIAAQALIDAMEGRLPEAREAVVQSLAAHYSAPELKAAAAYYASPDAPPRGGWDGPLGQMGARAFTYTTSKVVRDAFCARWLCAIDRQDLSLMADVAGPNPVVTVAAPVWEAAPSPAAFGDATPGLARLMGLPGRTRLNCRIGEAGWLEACQIASEQPLNLGYGAAGLQLGPRFRVSRQQVGQGAVGETTTVVIAFPVQPPPAPPPAPTARSPHAVDLAIRVVAAGGAGEAMRREWREYAFRTLEATPGLDPAVQSDIHAMLNAAQQPASIAMLAQTVVYLTQAMTDPQLASMAAFLESPAGQAWEAGRRAVAMDIVQREARLFAQVSREAGEAFCRKQGCQARDPSPQSPPAPPPRP